MMIAAMVLIIFNVVFWTLFEQAGSSLTLFADRNTDLSVFGLFSISAGADPVLQRRSSSSCWRRCSRMLWNCARAARPRAADPDQVRRSR